MIHHLENKNIVVVGGTSGIGNSAVRSFVNNGAHVIAIGLPVDNLIELDHCMYQFDDATSEGVASDAIKLCVSKFGSFDGLMHVAGGSGRKWGDGPLHSMSTEAWQKTLDLNLKSVMLSNKAAVQQFMKLEKGGSIVNTSTVLAEHPSPKFFHTHAYAAAKAGIIGLSKSIAAYYAPYNIRVNVISPALTVTPMANRAIEREDIQHFIRTKQPLDGGRAGIPTDIDSAACYFMSDGSSFTTGQVLAIDGGWSVSEGQYQND